jgi:hypothetical protein
MSAYRYQKKAMQRNSNSRRCIALLDLISRVNQAFVEAGKAFLFIPKRVSIFLSC